MSLIKNISTEIKENIQNSRQGNISIGLKEIPIPYYLPKPTRPEELDFILNDNDLFDRVKGFVIEIQDFYDITQNCRRYTNQETLEKGMKNPYDKFKEKLLMIDILPEQLYFKCTERNRFRKLPDIPQSLEKLINFDVKTYESNWREISNNKQGLDIQTWALKTQSSISADTIMPLTPFLCKPSITLLKINYEMNIKLQDVFAISKKEYDAEPTISYSMNYSVFNDRKFTDKLIDSIAGVADLQMKRAEERDIRKASIVFIKIYGLNTKQTQCRNNFKMFLNSMSNIRDAYDLNFVFLDCTNLQGQLFLSCGADLFSERTTGRANIMSSKGGMGFGRIYVAEDGYYTNISHDEYLEKFKANENKPLCSHEYCNKIEEILKAQKAKSLRDIKFKIGHSNDASLNYLNPYN
jgi:hypothetical protein